MLEKVVEEKHPDYKNLYEGDEHQNRCDDYKDNVSRAKAFRGYSSFRIVAKKKLNENSKARLKKNIV